LLGKRVDYSGRSVIVVGPKLKIYQCGLPREMAIELFKPFVMKKLVQTGDAHNIKSAKRMVEKLEPKVWDALEEIIKEHPIMLNRAPTLHRLGIQAFEPVLVEGRALMLHPLVCAAYNADFDGDQMAVHVPLSVEAQAECRFLLLAPNNLLKPSDGLPITVPSKDMVLGIYYLTLQRDGLLGEGKAFMDDDEAVLAYDNHEIHLHAKIRVRRYDHDTGASKMVETTVGRVIFNQAIPQDLGFVDRSVDPFSYEINELVNNKMISKIVSRCINKYGSVDTSVTLDNVKDLGFRYATQSALSVSVSDMEVPDSKPEILKQADDAVDNVYKLFRRGLMTDDERSERVLKIWTDTADKVAEDLMDNLSTDNSVYMMLDSGARGSKTQMKQMAGMRGLLASPTGKTLEMPVRSNYREGLTVLEYFISGHSARKGLSDTALRTADSGYLTRRMVDVSQDIIIREEDCVKADEAKPGMWVKSFVDGEEIIEPLVDRIRGRWAIEDVKHPETGNVLAFADTIITPDQADAIEAAGVEEVFIRTVLTCRSRIGLCSKCYGANMASGRIVRIGESVGIIAAQSIGEPGTQLTMRTFQVGGVATNDDITKGLPRVEEIFEARKPKGLAIIAEFGGAVTINDIKKKREVVISNPETGEEKAYLIPYGSRIKVHTGQVVEPGSELTEGSVYPHDILKIKGVRGVQDYMIQEVQRVYDLHGVDINDKHIEVIVRQMLKRVKIEESGDTELLPGSLVDWLELEEINKQMEAEGLQPAEGTRVLLGITKASLATDSFLSAASFQETTRVLTEAAIRGKEDHLIGLKENVIIGQLIPAGTGMPVYRSVEVEDAANIPDNELVYPSVADDM
jgi:DNA-directed RNA polymerase subunit beta'